MEKKSATADVGFQMLQSAMRTGSPELNSPAADPVRLAGPSAEMDREIVWLVLGGLAGAFAGCAEAILTGGDLLRGLVLKAIIGAVLGIVGSRKGEQWRVGRFGDRPVQFWSVYWLLFWAMVPVLLTAALHLWASCKALFQGAPPPSLGFAGLVLMLMAATAYGVCGAAFGAVGGTIKYQLSGLSGPATFPGRGVADSAALPQDGLIPPTNEPIQDDKLAVTVARVLVMANRAASAFGTDPDQSLISIAQEAPPSEHVWRVGYRPRDVVYRHCGDVVILIDSCARVVKQVIRGFSRDELEIRL